MSNVSTSTEPLAKLAYRPSELAAALGVSRRSIERERAAGRFPPPDRRIGRIPLWSAETLRAFLVAGDPNRA